ncbi:MAG: hypothetical protein L6Q84_35450 [Polyangiaceae bacterium]|nr:hypothetical protein [Polyangiaceae bacterium]
MLERQAGDLGDIERGEKTNCAASPELDANEGGIQQQRRRVALNEDHLAVCQRYRARDLDRRVSHRVHAEMHPTLGYRVIK